MQDTDHQEYLLEGIAMESLNKKMYRFEWKKTDDETLERMLQFFQKNINLYMGLNISIGWNEGVYSTDGTIFLTKHASENGCLYRTGTDDDNWFYTYFMVLIKDEKGDVIEGTSLYKSRLTGSEYKCFISENIEIYYNAVANAMEFYENEKRNLIEYSSE